MKENANTESNFQNKKANIYLTVVISGKFLEHQRKVEEEKQIKEQIKLERIQKKKTRLLTNILESKLEWMILILKILKKYRIKKNIQRKHMLSFEKNENILLE